MAAFVLCVLDVDWRLFEASVLCYHHATEPGHNNTQTALRASMAGVHTVGSATLSLTALLSLVFARSCLLMMDVGGECQNIFSRRCSNFFF